MYTRCPSCGAEISFEPPANRERLPEDYKHRIRCPICGVTIGVKLNKPIFAQTTYPVYANQPVPVQTAFEPVLSPSAPVAPPVQRRRQTIVTTTTQQPQAKTKTKKKALSEKKSGVGRNVLMMIFSLVFVALSVVAYLLKIGTIPKDIVAESYPWLINISFADGISPIEMMIKNFDYVKALFSADLGLAIVTIVPSVLFVLAGLNFIVAFISAIGKKYGRAYNLLMSVILCGLAVTVFFIPYIMLQKAGLTIPILDYFKTCATVDGCLIYCIAGWGVLQLFFALCFIKSLKRKKKKRA